MTATRMTRWLPAALPAIAVALILPSAAAAHTPPVVKLPAIAGSPEVGETLRGSAQVTGDPIPAVDYQWLQCAPADEAKCDSIEGATNASYVVTVADTGHRLAVRVHAVNSAGGDRKRSKLTEVVTTRSGPVPEPEPEPGTGPGVAAPVVPAPRFLDPFPIVRVKGKVFARGARITLLRVRAPSGAAVAVRCKGPGCGPRRRSVADGRIARLERYLRAGTRITIRISMGDVLGKYVRLVIRGGQRPKRIDACLAPGSSSPIDCPQA